MNTKNIDLERVEISLKNNREESNFRTDTNYFMNNYDKLSAKQKEDINKAWEMLAGLIINRPMFYKFIESTEDILKWHECNYIKDKSVKAIDFNAIFDNGKCNITPQIICDLPTNKQERISTIIAYYTQKLFETDAWNDMIKEIKEVENE